MKRAVKVLLVLTIMLSMLFAVSVNASAASVVEQDGLEVSILTDKEIYAEGEEIQVSISVKNNNTYDVSGISIETLLPEGLNIKTSGLTGDDITISAGDTYSVDVVAESAPEETKETEPAPTEPKPTEPKPTEPKPTEPKPTEPKPTEPKPTEPKPTEPKPTEKPADQENAQTGDSFDFLLWTVLLIVSAVGIIVLFKYKKGMKTMCLLLCAAMLLSMIPATAFATEEDTATITVDKTITVADEEHTLSVKMTYPKPAVPEGAFTVTFDSNGGSAVASQTVNSGDLLERPADPAREGYVFSGWYIDSEFATKFDFTTPITESITLYAKWMASVDGVATGEDDSVSVYAIYGLTVDPQAGTITATVSAPENCAIVVRFAEEDVYFSDDFATNGSYINNGDTFASHVVAAGSDRASVTASINNSLPTHFVAVATLIDANNVPLCDPYSCIEHTERYEVFDEKTVYDFEAEDTILNFDADLDNNFGVLADDVRVLSAEDVDMVDVDGDGEEDIYKITNPSDTINVLDKVFIQDEEGSFLFKVNTIADEQGVLTIVPAKADDAEAGFGMEDFYKFLKVDMSLDDAADNDNADENAQAPATRNARDTRVSDVYENISASTTLSFSPLNFDNDKFQATAKLSGTISATLVMEWDIVLFGEDYMRCEFEYEIDATVKFDVAAKWEAEEEELNKEQKELKFGKIRIPFAVTGVGAFVDMKLKVDWEITAGLSVEIKVKNTSGFKYNTIDGFQKVEEKEHSWTVDVKGHAEIKIGLAPQVGVEFLDGVLSCGLECFFGGVAEADAVIPTFQGGDSKHACYLCIEGEVRLEISVSAKLSYKLGPIKGTPIDWEIIKVEKPLFDFYISLLNGTDSQFHGLPHAGMGSCPNQSYKTTVYTMNAAGQAVDTTVAIYNKDDDTLVTTVSTGEAYYLNSGNYVARTTIEGTALEKTFTVTDGSKMVYLNAVTSDGYINGSVMDKTTGTGLSAVTIKVYEYTTCVATYTTDASGKYKISLDSGTYKLEASRDGYVTATQYFTIRDGENKYLEAMMLAKEDSDRIMGGIFGMIKDGITGLTVSGVEIKISRGWGNEGVTDTYVAELVTNENGEYSCRKNEILGIDFGLDAGNYTITIGKEGYITTSFNITVVGGEDLEFNSTITPEGAEDIWHIVLTWGYSPSDLDSHFNGTYNGYRDHVYYSAKQGGASNLDVDDTTSYGPETITIEDASQYTGNMMYSVHDYSNRYYDSSTAMSLSGAVVKVYRGGVLLETFNVPANVSGTVWNVFYIDENANVVPVNTFTSISTPSEVVGSTE